MKNKKPAGTRFDELLEKSRDLFNVNKKKLDTEWERQSPIYHEWAVLQAEEQEKLDNLKAKLDVTEAEVQLAIRADPGKYGIENPREADYKLRTAVDEQVVVATTKINRQKKIVALIDGTLRALEHRKRTLEKLTDLDARDYFSKPTVSKQKRMAADDHEVERSARRYGKGND